MARASKSQPNIIRVANRGIRDLVAGIDPQLHEGAERDILKALDGVRKKYEDLYKKGRGNRVGLQREVIGVIGELSPGVVFREEDIAAQLAGDPKIGSLTGILFEIYAFSRQEVTWKLDLVNEKSGRGKHHYMKLEPETPGEIKSLDHLKEFTDLTYFVLPANRFSELLPASRYGEVLVNGLNTQGYYPSPVFDPNHPRMCDHTAKELEQFGKFVELSGLPTGKRGENVVLVYDSRRMRQITKRRSFSG